MYLSGLHFTLLWQQLCNCEVTENGGTFSVFCDEGNVSRRYLELEHSNENSIIKSPQSWFPLVVTADAAVLVLQCFKSSCRCQQERVTEMSLCLLWWHFMGNIFSFNILIQIPKDPTASCSCRSVRLSFALWRGRKDSPIPVSTWRYGFPITTTWSRRANTWIDWKIICTMTFKGIVLFTTVVIIQCCLLCYFKSVCPLNLSFSLMFSPEP